MSEADAGSETVPPPVAARIDEACDRFEAAWKAGDRPRIEDALGVLPEPWPAALLRELLVVERAYRARAGEAPGPDEYRHRFPAHAALVDAVFGVTNSSTLI